MGRHTIVVTPHHRCIIGIRTDDGEPFTTLLQGQDTILILQQHDSLSGHTEGEVG